MPLIARRNRALFPTRCIRVSAWVHVLSCVSVPRGGSRGKGCEPQLARVTPATQRHQASAIMHSTCTFPEFDASSEPERRGASAAVRTRNTPLAACCLPHQQHRHQPRKWAAYRQTVHVLKVVQIGERLLCPGAGRRGRTASCANGSTQQATVTPAAASATDALQPVSYMFEHLAVALLALTERPRVVGVVVRLPRRFLLRPRLLSSALAQFS